MSIINQIKKLAKIDKDYWINQNLIPNIPKVNVNPIVFDISKSFYKTLILSHTFSGSIESKIYSMFFPNISERIILFSKVIIESESILNDNINYQYYWDIQKNYLNILVYSKVAFSGTVNLYLIINPSYIV